MPDEDVVLGVDGEEGVASGLHLRDERPVLTLVVRDLHHDHTHADRVQGEAAKDLRGRGWIS